MVAERANRGGTPERVRELKAIIAQASARPRRCSSPEASTSSGSGSSTPTAAPTPRLPKPPDSPRWVAAAGDPPVASAARSGTVSPAAVTSPTGELACRPSGPLSRSSPALDHRRRRRRQSSSGSSRTVSVRSPAGIASPGHDEEVDEVAVVTVEEHQEEVDAAPSGAPGAGDCAQDEERSTSDPTDVSDDVSLSGSETTGSSPGLSRLFVSSSSSLSLAVPGDDSGSESDAGSRGLAALLSGHSPGTTATAAVTANAVVTVMPQLQGSGPHGDEEDEEGEARKSVGEGDVADGGACLPGRDDGEKEEAEDMEGKKEEEDGALHSHRSGGASSGGGTRRDSDWESDSLLGAYRRLLRSGSLIGEPVEEAAAAVATDAASHRAYRAGGDDGGGRGDDDDDEGDGKNSSRSKSSADGGTFERTVGTAGVGATPSGPRSEAASRASDGRRSVRSVRSVVGSDSLAALEVEGPSRASGELDAAEVEPEGQTMRSGAPGVDTPTPSRGSGNLQTDVPAEASGRSSGADGTGGSVGKTTIEKPASDLPDDGGPGERDDGGSGSVSRDGGVEGTVGRPTPSVRRSGEASRRSSSTRSRNSTRSRKSLDADVQAEGRSRRDHDAGGTGGRAPDAAERDPKEMGSGASPSRSEAVEGGGGGTTAAGEASGSSRQGSATGGRIRRFDILGRASGRAGTPRAVAGDEVRDEKEDIPRLGGTNDEAASKEKDRSEEGDLEKPLSSAVDRFLLRPVDDAGLGGSVEKEIRGVEDGSEEAAKDDKERSEEGDLGRPRSSAADRSPPRPVDNALLSGSVRKEIRGVEDASKEVAKKEEERSEEGDLGQPQSNAVDRTPPHPVDDALLSGSVEKEIRGVEDGSKEAAKDDKTRSEEGDLGRPLSNAADRTLLRPVDDALLSGSIEKEIRGVEDGNKEAAKDDEERSEEGDLGRPLSNAADRSLPLPIDDAGLGGSVKKEIRGVENGSKEVAKDDEERSGEGDLGRPLSNAADRSPPLPVDDAGLGGSVKKEIRGVENGSKEVAKDDEERSGAGDLGRPLSNAADRTPPRPPVPPNESGRRSRRGTISSSGSSSGSSSDSSSSSSSDSNDDVRARGKSPSRGSRRRNSVTSGRISGSSSVRNGVVPKRNRGDPLAHSTTTPPPAPAAAAPAAGAIRH
ncbi:protein qua-1-like [Lethenteron reissneri]|uniref:protein qua-1-like n=1 Tax=Lethenteron reissneri TaxID=7753 RepID=UPI002AB5EBA1|nr:protein qua-1-like [Lethenteron reissneri]